MRCRSFAKINLHLEVRGRRPDGYHELLTVFQTIDLHDVLTIDDAPPGEIHLAVRGADLDAGPSNLAHRAAAAYLDRYRPRHGVSIELEKTIAMGAGLGGGSSNAATVLLALRQRDGMPDRVAELAPLARALGADVPYFLVGGTALGTGRGDEVRPLVDLPEEAILLALSQVHLSTAEVFAASRPGAAPIPPGIAALLRGEAPACLADLEGRNDLEPAAVMLRPELRHIPELLTEAGARRVVMTGSGSCFVGLTPSGSGIVSGRPGDANTRTTPARTLTRASTDSSRFL